MPLSQRWSRAASSRVEVCAGRQVPTLHCREGLPAGPWFAMMLGSIDAFSPAASLLSMPARRRAFFEGPPAWPLCLRRGGVAIFD